MKFIGNTLSIAAALVVVLAFFGYHPISIQKGDNRTPNILPDNRDPDTRRPLLRRPLLPLIQPKDMPSFEAGPKYPTFENHNSASGEEPAVDYPEEEWIKNIGSKLGDHAGMCVFSSFEMMMIWHGFEDFRGFRNWCAERYPGGGYPDKLDKLIDAYCAAKHIDKPQIIQYVGDNPMFLQQAIENGFMPCTTLAHSPRYGPNPISHMVNCVHLTDHNGAIMDNNFKDFEWQEGREQFLAKLKYRDPNNGRPVYWAVIVVAPPPPPPPKRVR